MEDKKSIFSISYNLLLLKCEAFSEGKVVILLFIYMYFLHIPNTVYREGDGESEGRVRPKPMKT